MISKPFTTRNLQVVNDLQIIVLSWALCFKHHWGQVEYLDSDHILGGSEDRVAGGGGGSLTGGREGCIEVDGWGPIKDGGENRIAGGREPH